MRNIFNYVDRPSPIHKLTGATKLVCLLLWNLAAMVTYDTRLLILLPILSLGLFFLSKIKFKDVSFMLTFTLVFLALNNLMIFLFSPEHGIRGDRQAGVTIDDVTDERGFPRAIDDRSVFNQRHFLIPPIFSFPHSLISPLPHFPIFIFPYSHITFGLGYGYGLWLWFGLVLVICVSSCG